MTMNAMIAGIGKAKRCSYNCWVVIGTPRTDKKPNLVLASFRFMYVVKGAQNEGGYEDPVNIHYG